MYLDAETGLHNNLSRYYDLTCGRLTQHDTIVMEGGLSTYAYVPVTR
ncbi:RHS repeat-associated core domain-containing protein [Erwinia amylovora]|uniref:Protein rhsB n=1 Tax=Erwinia amylovora ATCC BAA-2158 TaxID=889211 RepID=E5B8T7_ERWAM|nr:Protein rhsB [Erwinia amylovora ATCC BAA-2158]